MDIYHVSRNTISVTEEFTPGKKIPIEEGLNIVFLAARLLGGEFKCLIDKHVQLAQSVETKSRTVNTDILSGTRSNKLTSEFAATQNVLKKWPV